MVIYFSGTGNSRYVATIIARELDDELICANERIKEGKREKFHSDKPYIFVFPVYLSTVAKVFKDFMRESDYEGTKDAYFVATCAGAVGSSSNICEKICKEKQLNFKGCEMIIMPQNYIVYFKMTEEEECRRRQDAAIDSAKAICEVIKQGRELVGRRASAFEYGATLAVEKMYYGPFTGTRKFYATDECVGCGLCEKVCVLNNIEMMDGKPKWKKSCMHCMACINQCPKKAIEFGKKTVGKTRYVCREYREEKR